MKHEMQNSDSLMQQLTNELSKSTLNIVDRSLIPKAIGGFKSKTDSQGAYLKIFESHVSRFKESLRLKYATVTKIKEFMQDHPEYSKHLREIRQAANLKFVKYSLYHEKSRIEQRKLDDHEWASLLSDINRENYTLNPITVHNFYVVRNFKYEEPADLPLSWWQRIFGK